LFEIVRIGMHSGPVTAGVLRGERARFQLFGDTMNTTARIESTGERGRIHMSTETAELLLIAGKKSWLEKRKDKVEAKGKGLIVTYWLTTDGGDTKSQCSDHGFGCVIEEGMSTADQRERNIRLVEWNVEILLKILKQIVALRLARNQNTEQGSLHPTDEPIMEKKNCFLGEVTEIIALPEFDSSAAMRMQDPEKIELPPEVAIQLREYIIGIASMYRENPFHNFEHASHVMLSVVKLLSRIVAPSEIDLDSDDEAAILHDHTYGITSDPLTQFACAFGALIHDVDHTGKTCCICH
jgi:Adenylate and Guanylate cyclase catalytic domain/3'5'-cyclic nucleotide phosphodiesterase